MRPARSDSVDASAPDTAPTVPRSNVPQNSGSASGPSWLTGPRVRLCRRCPRDRGRASRAGDRRTADRSPRVPSLLRLARRRPSNDRRWCTRCWLYRACGHHGTRPVRDPGTSVRSTRTERDRLLDASLGWRRYATKGVDRRLRPHPHRGVWVAGYLLCARGGTAGSDPLPLRQRRVLRCRTPRVAVDRRRD